MDFRLRSWQIPLKDMDNGDWFMPRVPGADLYFKVDVEKTFEEQALHESLEENIRSLVESLEKSGRVLAINFDKGKLTSFPEEEEVEWYVQAETIQLNMIAKV